MIAIIVLGLVACGCVISAWRRGELNRPLNRFEERVVGLRREFWQDRPEVK